MQGKLSQSELRARMSAIRADINRRISAADIGLSAAPADIAERRAKVMQCTPEAFRFFCKTYLPHYFPDDSESVFHTWAYTELPEIEKEPESVLQGCAASRGEAKTSLTVQAFALWREVRNAKHNTVIVSDTEDQADAIVEAIKTELTDNPALQLDFPEVCGQGQVWRIGEIRTRQNNQFKAYGAGQGIRGAKKGEVRPDAVYLDDLENEKHSENIRLRDKLTKWIGSVINPLGGAGAKCDILYVGTILCLDSVLARVLKNPFWRSVRFSAIMKWPINMDLWAEWENIYRNTPKENRANEKAAQAFYEVNEAAMLEGSEVSWSKRPLLALMKIRARDGIHVFNCEYQNQPGNPENAIFADYLDNCYYRTLPHDVVYFGAVDPSLGKQGKGADPSAILVGGYQRATGTLFVVEASIKKRVPSLIIQDVIRLQKQYGCLLWVIETVQFQEFFKDELIKEAAKQGAHVPARGVKPSAEKVMRIESIQPHFANGFIKLLPEQRVLIEQLREFPDADHDDGPDALHMLWSVAVANCVRIEWQSPTDNDFGDEIKSKWSR